jgi:hypothetical protein
MFDRVKKAIEQSQAMLDTMKDSEHKQMVTQALDKKKLLYKEVTEQNIPCPPHLEASVSLALSLIEDLYNKTAAN